MKIERKAIEGVKEVPEDMKNAAIARKKAFVKKAKIPKGMERVKCPRCFGRPGLDKNCPQDGCNGSGWIVRLKKKALKAKKVVAKPPKPAIIKAKVVAAVKNVVFKKKKGNKHGKGRIRQKDN